MNKFIFLYFLLFSWSLSADTYDDALKLEAKGDIINATQKLYEYFDENINNPNQDSVIEKLLYSSTLFDTLDETIIFLNKYVKYNENPESRYRIYIKLAELYELSGEIKLAGQYYELAAYTINGFIDFKLLVNSVDLLIELGYLDIAEKKLIDLDNKNIGLKDEIYALLSRIYYLLDNKIKALYYFSLVNSSYRPYNFLKYELGLFNIDNFPQKEKLNYMIINSPYKKLRNPADFINRKMDLYDINEIKFPENNETEIFLGSFAEKKDASGIINILEQMNIKWFFDNDNGIFKLFLFTNEPNKIADDFKRVGINLRIENE